MSLLTILKYPDPRLKQSARPLDIAEINSTATKNIIENMFETMYQADGVGLAATQVNVHLQIITIDLAKKTNNSFCLINPRIIDKDHVIIYHEEGCLSFPGVFAKVKRHQRIIVEFFEPSGKLTTLEAQDLLSICIQHEIDHLKGITFFDHLSPLKRSLLEKKLNKLAKKPL